MSKLSLDNLHERDLLLERWRCLPSSKVENQHLTSWPPSEKALRQVYAYLGAQHVTALSVGQTRALLAAARHCHTRAKAIQTEHYRAISDLEAKHPKLGSSTLAAMLSVAPLSKASHHLLLEPSSLHPEKPREQRQADFLARRSRKDWPREMRALHGGEFFSDSMLLGMLGKAPAAEAVEIASFILQQAALAGSVDGVVGALSLGADPLAAIVTKFGEPKLTYASNVLGFVLGSDPPYPLNTSNAFKHPLCVSDEPLWGPALLVLAATAPEDIPTLTQLLPRGFMTPPQKHLDALALSFSRGFLGCATTFFDMGMNFTSPGGALALLPYSSIKGFHPVRAHAFGALLARAESRELAASSSSTDFNSSPRRSASRL